MCVHFICLLRIQGRSTKFWALYKTSADVGPDTICYIFYYVTYFYYGTVVDYWLYLFTATTCLFNDYSSILKSVMMNTEQIFLLKC